MKILLKQIVMQIDPNNPVVKLCAEGVSLELSGKKTEAKNCYEQAWNARANDYDACIVAHYIARIQDTPEDGLRWNLEALRYAESVGGDQVKLFFPSLYLNVGKSYEDMGDIEQAKKYYTHGIDTMAQLPEDKLGNMTRDGLIRGLKRLKHTD